VRSIYELSPQASELLEAYGVDYIVVGPGEKDRLGADPDAFRARYTSVIHTATYEVFETRRDSSQ
jgi:uncharacterized membrane protein